MIAALSYILFSVALVILFGCFYVAWAILSDLMAGWSEVCHRGRFPKQFGISLLFAVTAVFAITCFLLQELRMDGLGEMIVMFAISLTWAAAIVYVIQCMLSEYHRGTGSRRRAGAIAATDEPATSEKASSAPPGDDDSPVELQRWLSSQADRDSKMGDHVRRASTNATRSHFRVKMSEDPKGVKFGRV